MVVSVKGLARVLAVACKYYRTRWEWLGSCEVVSIAV